MSRRQLPLLVLLLSVAACSDDNDPDPRLAFDGSYRLEDFQFTYTVFRQDTVANEAMLGVSTGPRVLLDASGNASNKMKIDFEELIEDLLVAYSPQLVGDIKVESNYPMLITLTDNAFFLEDARFTLIVDDGENMAIVRSQITMEGELDQGNLAFDFEVMLGGTDNSVSFSGAASGKQEP